MDVSLIDSFTPGLGDEFDILDFASAAGAGFDTVDLPDLGAGLGWDTSNLLTTGVLAVVAGGAAGAVPEPAGCLLMLIGVTGLAAAAGRRARS